MSTPNNMDWGGVFGQIFGSSASYTESLKSLSNVDGQLHAIVLSALEVYQHFGPGLLRSVYADALGIEFDAQGVPYVRDQPVTLSYRGRSLDTGHTIDFLCFQEVLVLVRADAALPPERDQELISHLKSTGFLRGITLNFGVKRLDFRRVAASGAYQKPLP